MASVLRVRPANVQAKFKGSFVPPLYNFLKVEVSVAAAIKLAETYGLKSTDIIVNQNTTSTQYVSFRHFLTGEPFRFIDVSIGLDQAEVVFSNPATVSELINEVGGVWKIIIESLQPLVKTSYLEATLHCETEGAGAKAFLNEIVQAPADSAEFHKGFSVSMQNADVSARMSLDVSTFIPDGLYVVFAYVSTVSMLDVTAIAQRYEAALAAYRKLQSVAGIQILEPT